MHIYSFGTRYSTNHWSCDIILAPKTTFWCYIIAIATLIFSSPLDLLLEQLQCTHSLPIFSLHGQYLRIENKKHNSNATPYPSFILGERKFNPLFEGWKSKPLYSPCHHQLIYPLVFLSFTTAISLSISVAYVNLKYRGSI